MSGHARAERLALCDLMAELGPDAATLCEGWTTRDLAAHLAVRERRPDAAPGILLPALSGRLARVQATYRARPWTSLLGLVRSGPPRWSPYGLLRADELVNTVEMLVHHEDVRRAREGWEPRALDPGLEAVLWSRLRSLGPLLFRRAPVGVRLERDGGEARRAHRGRPTVILTGPPAELVLYGFGRQVHALVELSGPRDAVELLRAAPLGL